MANVTRQQVCFNVSGDLDRHTVMATWPDAASSMASMHQELGSVVVDLSDVKHVDTAGLAWIMQLIQDSLQQNYALQLKNVPQGILNLAKLSNVDSLLPMA